MDARVSVNESGHLADLEGKGGIFEWLLHLAGSKQAQIASIGRRPALTRLAGDAHEVVSRGDLLGEGLNVRNGLVF